jgi:frataxin-like iron-binding protein CyaY
MDYFQFAKVKYDDRMDEAIKIIINKKNKDGLWNLPANHPGQMHFDMKKPGEPSHWITLRALRVLRHFKKDE